VRSSIRRVLSGPAVAVRLKKLRFDLCFRALNLIVWQSVDQAAARLCRAIVREASGGCRMGKRIGIWSGGGDSAEVDYNLNLTVFRRPRTHKMR